MQKVSARAVIAAVLKDILFIGISIQIFLGLVWMVCNFRNVPQFGESLFMLRLSKTLRCDEYTGILYPLFLRIAGGNHFIVYAVQLVLAFMAGVHFLQGVRPAGRMTAVWRGLALLTLPMAMQCHLAVLPCSFAASLSLLQLGFLLEMVRDFGRRTLRQLGRLMLCWLLLALLLPEYIYLGAAPVLASLPFFLRRGKAQMRRACGALLLFCAFAGMIWGINSLTQTRGLYGRAQKNPILALTGRIAWTNLRRDAEEWPEELQGLVEEESILLDSAFYADNMELVFFPVIERAVGVERSREFFWEMTRIAWDRHGSMILREMAWDILGYGASPALLQVQLTGEGYDSMSGRNYELMLYHTPALSRYYMDYGSWLFCLTVPLTLLLQAGRLFSGKGRKKADKMLCVQGGEKAGTLLQVFLCMCMAGLMVVWYTMQGAGLMDYKSTLLVTELWLIWPLLLL